MRPVTNSGGGGGLSEPVTFTQPVTVQEVPAAEFTQRWLKGDGSVAIGMFSEGYWGYPGMAFIGPNSDINFYGSSAMDSADNAYIGREAEGFHVIVGSGLSQGFTVQGKTMIDVPFHTESGPTLTVKGNNGSVQRTIMDWQNDAGAVVGRMWNAEWMGNPEFTLFTGLYDYADFTIWTDVDQTHRPFRIAAGRTAASGEMWANFYCGTLGGPIIEMGKTSAGVAQIGFFNTVPVAKPTGVPVTAQGIHDALVSLGLIAA